jgi:hypothetical protein
MDKEQWIEKFADLMSFFYSRREHQISQAKLAYSDYKGRSLLEAFDSLTAGWEY